MNCDRAQAVLSARLDGERAPERVGAAVDAHAATCARCRTFEAGALRVRTSVRVRPAEPVPDLVGSIMTRVTAEAGARPRRPAPAPAPVARRPSRSPSRRLAPVLAATIAGVMAGSVVVGGPWQRSTNTPIAAAAVVAGVQATAPTLDSFAATFAVTEHGLSPDVPERRLRMDVAFLAPQRFRLDVHDETTYPSTRWTPTDLTFIADGSSTYRSGATGCPADLPAGGCPPTRTTITTRSAYSVRAPAPADLVLPLTTFSSADGIQVLGTDRVAGRDAIRVQLTFARAQALFPFLAARRDLASVLRRRPRGSLARCLGLVPVALHGLSVHRSGANPVGAPVRHPARTDGRADLRRPALLARPERARPRHVRGPRLVERAERAARLVPPTRRVPAGHADVAGCAHALVGGRAARRRARRAELRPPVHGRHGVRADRGTPGLDRTEAVRSGGPGRTAGGPVGRRRRVLRAGGRRPWAATRDPRVRRRTSSSSPTCPAHSS